MMKYLGRMAGNAQITQDGLPVGRASYDFEGFAGPKGRIVSSGEIKSTPAELKIVFGQRGVRLVTDDGRLLNLSFSDRVRGAANDVAHVEVTGDLPDTPAEWRS